MCDTLCMTAKGNEDGITYFAKNSDRSPNEPLLVLKIPEKKHAAGEVVQCTYISVPQVEYTREVIICKPSWMWGAEMGVNSARVAIGNEAVFTKAKKGVPALTGMDILRLALERAESACKAIEIMIDLLQEYGQGGNCGYDKEFHYDNSFLAADPTEAYIMETSGKNYAVLKVEDKYAISNRLSIGKTYSAATGLKNGEDFSKRFTEPVFSHFASGKARREQVMNQLSPTVSTKDLMQILRSHNTGFDGMEFKRGSVSSVCMHAGGLIGDHTTGSMIAVLRPDKPITLWLTGCSTPCISAFKPVFMNTDSAPLFDDEEQSLKYWLRRERIHRACIADKVDVTGLRKGIKALENDWLRLEESLFSVDAPDINALAVLSADANRRECELIDRFYAENWDNLPGASRYARYWKKKNAKLNTM